jgi:uncharacterized protein YhbP (UPF0306 family)
MKLFNTKEIYFNLFFQSILLCGGFNFASAQPENIPKINQDAPDIVLGVKTPKVHPDISDVQTCMECHKIKSDGTTTATQRYLQGKGKILLKEDLWNEIVAFFGEKKSCVLATSINNEPYVTTIDFALDPTNKIFYALSEKGTRKLGQIAMNSKVAVEYHNQAEWKSLIFRCLQMRGNARVFSSEDPQFDKGLAVFKRDREKISVEAIKRGIDMTCFTPTEILFYDVLRKNKQQNVFQLWNREDK